MKSEEYKVSDTGSAAASGHKANANSGYQRIRSTSFIFNVKEFIKVHVVIPVKGAVTEERPGYPLEDNSHFGADDDPSEVVRRILVSPKILLFALLGIILIIFLSCLPSPDDKFTEDVGQRPVDAMDEAVRTAVRTAITDCAKAVVANPANCPQSDVMVTSKVVTWSLHDDPVDGLQSAWREDRFNVRGNAVMSILYEDAWGKKMKTHMFGYSTEVFWRDGKASVSPIAALPSQVKSVRKSAPDVSIDEVRPLVKSVFDDCAKAVRIPFPAQCPEVAGIPKQDQVTWTFSGDPLVNTAMTFEESSGLLHVTGSFASKINYELRYFGPVELELAGDFDALVAVDDGEPQVLQVLKK